MLQQSIDTSVPKQTPVLSRILSRLLSGAPRPSAAAAAATLPDNAPAPRPATMLCSQPDLPTPQPPIPTMSPTADPPPSPALPTSFPASILVVASQDTAQTASQVASKLGLSCLTARSMREAVASVLLNHHSIKLVVAALGKIPEEHLFQGRHSELIAAARAKGIPLCVFSHHACKHADVYRMCMDAGAVAVVQRGKDVKDLLIRILGHPPPSQEAPSPGPAAPPASEYPLLKHRFQHLEQLRQKHGEAHKATQHFLATTLQLQAMVQVTPPLAALGSSPAAGHVRFVTVSDTHAKHRELILPPGEVLLHCGDLTGNYGSETDQDLMAQLLDLADWLHSLTQYQRIFLTAGNHDTLLDTLQLPKYAQALRKFQAALPAHATLLLEGGAEYRGLRVWASPVVVCRLETERVRYYSSAFERREADRKLAWAQLPEHLDVLMTHTPSRGGHSDYLLEEALSRLQAPPRVHVFGHCHGGAGCGTAKYAGAGTKAAGRGVWINAAQNMFLLREPGFGGAAWVFDLPAKD